MNMRTYSVSLLGLACFVTTAQAELAVGLGIASSQDPQTGMDASHLAIPLISYTGERLSFQITTLSYRLVEVDDLSISATASARLQGYDAVDSPYLTGMKDRSNTVDGGVSLDWNGFSLSYTHDVLSKHQGDEVALAYTQGFGVGTAEVMLGVGITWQSAKLNQYYYGVEPSEARAFTVNNTIFERTAFKVEDALLPEINLLVKYPILNSWILIGGAEVSYLPKEITNSPIIQNNNVWGIFTGVMTVF